uniref:Uncharacterized protein n=1 Tax=Arundo donax TaxID=35708 RepID=A0A0A9EB50_ARUDO
MLPNLVGFEIMSRGQLTFCSVTDIHGSLLWFLYWSALLFHAD